MLTRFIFLLCLITGNFCLAQNCLDNILQNILYSNSGEIINGRKWIYEKKYSGSPLLMGDSWAKADISYNGNLFLGQFMNFDLQKNELIIYYPEKLKEKFILVNTDNLSGFSFTDSVKGIKHNYEFTEIPVIPGKALYEYIPAAPVAFYIRPVKKADISQVGTEQGRWLNYYEYYLAREGIFTRFRSKHQLFELLPENGSELKRYMRKKMIRINDQNPEGLYTAISFLNSLR
jgi:hypothetical protein